MHRNLIKLRISNKLSIKKKTNKSNILFVIAAIADSIPLTSVTKKHFDDISFNINVKGKVCFFAMQKALSIFDDK